MRKVLEYLLGQELLFALTCKSNYTHVISLRKDGILPMKRRSAYLRSRELAACMVAHDMTSPDSHLMLFAAAHGCLDGMMVLRETALRVRGMRKPAMLLLEAVIWMCCSGHALRILRVRGVRTSLCLQLKAVIWMCCSGHDTCSGAAEGGQVDTGSAVHFSWDGLRTKDSLPVG